MNMNMNNPSNNKALVVHSEDDKPSSSSSTEGVVLDALPYVEALDPNYENFALSLIEQEMMSSNNVQTIEEQQILNHPSLRKTNGINSHTSPNFGGNAPLAMAAYEQLVARKESNGDEEEDTTTTTKKPYFEINRPNPMSSIDSSKSNNISEEELISNLQTSIQTSKIQFETLRNQHMNLELNSNIQSSNNYTSYAQNLQNNYLNTTQVAVEHQRHVVDGINGTRMEEQRLAIDKLHGMNVKYDNLVDKNRRLGIAVTNLESEIENLKKTVVGGNDDDDVGVVKNVVEEDGDAVMGGE